MRRAMAYQRVRVYANLRSAHLERFHELDPASVVFCNTKYDFDWALLRGLDVHRVNGCRGLLRQLLVSGVREIEINEPLMLGSLKFGATAVLAARAKQLLLGQRVLITSYAIENKDPFTSGQARVHSWWRRSVYRTATRWLVRRLDRLAIGTPGSLDQYRPYLQFARPEIRVIPALPTACPTCPASRDDEQRRGVVFVGAFDERKGIRQLLDAWPLVRAAVPETSLRVLGKGPSERLAEEAAVRDPSISVMVDPERSQIHQAMRGAKVLVLLSQPSPTWREQVGLPIVEGLSHGCVIVTTGETGLSAWLDDHHHHIVNTNASALAAPAAVALAIRRALLDSRTPADVVRDLPLVDGRLAADRWMFDGHRDPTGE